MLDHAVGPNVIERLARRARASSSRRNADRGWTTLDDFRGLLRDRVVPHSQIRRPDHADYQGGYEPQEGYAEPVTSVRLSAPTTDAQASSHQRR